MSGCWVGLNQDRKRDIPRADLESGSELGGKKHLFLIQPVAFCCRFVGTVKLNP